MDEDIDQEAEEGKLDLLNPVETGAPPGAAEFSIEAQRDKFLGGGVEKTHTSEDTVTNLIKAASLRMQRETLPKNIELRKAFESYRSPHKSVSKEQLRARLENYVSLAKQDPSYQLVMDELREKLPEQLYLYRGGVEDSPARSLENYSVLPEVADIFAMGEEGYREGATMVRELVSRDQIVALGSIREAEVIVETKSTEAKAA